MSFILLRNCDLAVFWPVGDHLFRLGTGLSLRDPTDKKKVDFFLSFSVKHGAISPHFRPLVSHVGDVRTEKTSPFSDPKNRKKVEFVFLLRFQKISFCRKQNASVLFSSLGALYRGRSH